MWLLIFCARYCNNTPPRNPTSATGIVLLQAPGDRLGENNGSTSKVYESHPPGSFLRLFWDQQLQAIKTKDRHQLRWHPTIVKWCLNLKLMSSRTYNALRSTIVLPLECTLRDYTHCFESKPGFDDKLDKQLMK